MAEYIDTRPDFRVVWRITEDTGTFYIHVPLEFAKLRGLKKGDLVDMGIFRILTKPDRTVEKK